MHDQEIKHLRPIYINNPKLIEALRFYAHPIPGATMDPNVARLALAEAEKDGERCA